MEAREYFEKEYGHEHIEDVVGMGDWVSLYSLMDEFAEWKVKNCNTPLVSESVEPVCEVTVCPECDIEYWYNNRYGEYEPQCDCFKRQTER